MAIRKNKKFLTSQEKTEMMDKYKEDIDQYFLSIADKVSDYFVTEADKNIPVWESPVFNTFYHNPESGTHYNFVNSMLLWLANEQNGYKDTRFVTSKQAFDNGLSMEKGETGHYIIQHFGMPVSPVWERDEQGEVKKDAQGKPIPQKDENGKTKYIYKRASKLAKVFNVEQLKGDLPEKWSQPAHKTLSNEAELVLFRDALEKSSEAPIVRHNSGKNFYQHTIDQITLSNSDLFKSTMNEIATMAHEMGHSTGHKERLDRPSLYSYHEATANRGYEEIVANFTARAITEQYGLDKDALSETYSKNHDSYDASWMAPVLKTNPLLIFEATKDAELSFKHVSKRLETEMDKVPELRATFPKKEYKAYKPRKNTKTRSRNRRMKP